MPALAVTKPIGVLFLIDQLSELGGAERALMNMARLLPRDRFRCFIATFCLGNAIRWEEADCPVVEFPLAKTYGWNAATQAIRLSRFIRHSEVSIVHTFFETSDLFGGLIAKLSGCGVLVSSRRDMGIQRSRHHWPAYRLFRHLYDQVQTVSDEVADFMIRHDRLDQACVRTVYSGIDLTQVDAASPASDAVPSLNLPPDGPIIVTLANVRRVKGIDVLLNVVARVSQRWPGARFLVLGEILDSAYFSELQRLAAELRICDHVIFTGKCSRVFGVLKTADVFCLPSRSEGFSNALIEAMACSLPCVATDVGGNREAILDGVTGFLTPSEDADALAERIDQLLSDRLLATSIGRAARKRVEERFTTDAMIRRLTFLYDSLLQRKNPTSSL
jgi:glycosyltransferase involved in cell wall biosynthesis